MSKENTARLAFRIFADYGMIIVLLLLCVCFSVATYERQDPVGRTAAEQVLGKIRSAFPSSPKVVIFAPKTLDGQQFSELLTDELKRSNGKVLESVHGEPAEMRKVLEKLETAAEQPDVIACDSSILAFSFIRQLKTRFPGLSATQLLTANAYSWPTFLTAANLRAISNRIAVIAIIAIAMTMVIITAGIDLSVGSLIAFSAVVATWLIRASAEDSVTLYVPFHWYVAWHCSMGLVLLILGILRVRSKKTTSGALQIVAGVGLPYLATGAAWLGIFFLMSLRQNTATVKGVCLALAMGGFIALTAVRKQTLKVAIFCLVAMLLVAFSLIWSGQNVAIMTFSCLAAIVLSSGIGAFNGWMVTSFRVPPFIVTLAMFLIARSLAKIIANNETIYQIPDSFGWLGKGLLFGVPYTLILMLCLYLVAHIVMTKTVFGRYVYAVGGNREAARLSGVPVNLIVLACYVISGAMAGIGGIITASELAKGKATYGEMAELQVIAAVVVGGTSLAGGRGKILGTLIGALIIGVISNGMNLVNIESNEQGVVLGFVILGAVLLDQAKDKIWERITQTPLE